MSTKLYWLYKDAEPGGFNDQGWTDHGWASWNTQSLYGLMLDTVKEGDYHTQFNTQAAGGSILHFRALSRRLQPQTLSGTLNAIFNAAKQAAVTRSYFTRLFVFVVDTTSHTAPPVVKATLVDLDESTVSGAVPWALLYAVGAAFYAPSRQLKAPVTLTSYTVPSDGRDYRLLVEFGAHATGTQSGTEYSFTHLGVRSPRATSALRGPADSEFSPLPDLIPDGGIVLGAPYFEFSADIVFKATTNIANDEPERAIDMGVGPITLTTPVGVVNGNERYYQWFKYTQNNDRDRSVSVFLCSSGSPAGTHRLYPYEEINADLTGPPLEAYPSSALDGFSEVPVMMALKVGLDLFLKAWLWTEYSATLSVLEAPSESILPGDLMVTADDFYPNRYDSTLHGRYPSVFYRQDGTISAVDGHIASSELGVSLADGRYGIVDRNDQVIIYSAGSAEVLFKVDLDPIMISHDGGGITTIGTDFKDFYVAGYERPDTEYFTRFYRISKNGVVDSKTWVVPPPAGEWLGDGYKNMALSRDGATLYVQNTDDGSVYRHDMTNDVGLEPWVLPDDRLAEELLVLSDNTVIVTFSDGGYFHYAPNGDILHTLTISGSTMDYIDHVVVDADDLPGKLWIWRQGSGGSIPGGTNRFQLINIADGSVIKEFDAAQFRGTGVPDPTHTCSSPRWGAPGSCPLLIMMTPKSPVTPPGGPGGGGLVSPGIRVWALEVHPTILTDVEVFEGDVKSGQVVTYRVRATGAQNDPARGELINWYLSGAGVLLTSQSVTDADGYAMARVEYGVTETGTSVVEATLLC